MDKAVREKEKKIEELNEELNECEEWLRSKDDRIGELEEEIEGLKEEVEKNKYNNVVGDIPTGIDTSKKTYMDYKKISRESKQGSIVYGVEAWTDVDGLRMWGEFYCVAIGSYYGNVGDKFLVETDKGNVYKVIKADEKADKHTDSSNRYTVASGCMMEWIVETNKLSTYVKRSGNINNVEKVSGHIIKIIKIKE